LLSTGWETTRLLPRNNSKWISQAIYSWYEPLIINKNVFKCLILNFVDYINEMLEESDSNENDSDAKPGTSGLNDGPEGGIVFTAKSTPTHPGIYHIFVSLYLCMCILR
jgi:hypothetical protein